MDGRGKAKGPVQGLVRKQLPVLVIIKGVRACVYAYVCMCACILV